MDDIFDNGSELVPGKPHAKRMGREVAMQYLFRCELRGDTPDAATFEPFFEMVKEELELGENRIVRKTREYAEKLYTAVALHEKEIDGIIQKNAQNWKMDRLSAVDRNIMRVAVAEMCFSDGAVPPVVSIDEAVEIAMDYSGEEAGSFINGVLNGIKNNLGKN